MRICKHIFAGRAACSRQACLCCTYVCSSCRKEQTACGCGIVCCLHLCAGRCNFGATVFVRCALPAARRTKLLYKDPFGNSHRRCAIVKAKLCLPSETMQLDAFCDSGNMLFFNNLPVCFAVGSFAKHFGSILAEQLLCGNVSTIPFNTMSGEGRCLAIKCQLTVNQQKRWCYLALSNSHCSVDYQILLNGDFA